MAVKQVSMDRQDGEVPGLMADSLPDWEVFALEAGVFPDAPLHFCDCGGVFFGPLEAPCPVCWGHRCGSVTYPVSMGGAPGDIERIIQEEADHMAGQDEVLTVYSVQLTGDRRDRGVQVNREIHPPLVANPMSDQIPGVGPVAVDLQNTRLGDEKTGALDTTRPSWGGGQGVLAPTPTSTNDPSRSPQSAEVTQQIEAVHRATLAVRRLTPKEAERLQGFPDGWTDIPDKKGKPAADGVRYKALGNSWAVPVVAWLGRRMAVEMGLEVPGEAYDPANVKCGRMR